MTNAEIIKKLAFDYVSVMRHEYGHYMCKSMEEEAKCKYYNDDNVWGDNLLRHCANCYIKKLRKEKNNDK